MPELRAKTPHATAHLEIIDAAKGGVVKQENVDFLVSDYIEGTILSQYVQHQKGKHLTPFEGLHIIYALCKGIEPIHEMGEYHGDLHSENIIIQRKGIGFDIKLIDFFDLGIPSKRKTEQDIIDIIYILYEILGGRKYYHKLPPEIKKIEVKRERDYLYKVLLGAIVNFINKNRAAFSNGPVA